LFSVNGPGAMFGFAAPVFIRDPSITRSRQNSNLQPVRLSGKLSNRFVDPTAIHQISIALMAVQCGGFWYETDAVLKSPA